MKAVILAGGLGTRLRPLTLNIPKPVIPIVNQPFLLRQIESLKSAGITDIILSLNYQPSAIEKILGDGSAFGVNLRYLIEPKPLGTAGAFRFAQPFLNSAAIVLNGDILTDIDLKSVIHQHQKNNAVATIVLTEVENPSAYGLVESNQNSQVVRFLEKPKPEDISELKIRTINAGIYILEPQVLDLIPKGANYSFEYQLFPELLARKDAFYAYIAAENYWLDIGTPSRYLQAHQDLLSGKVENFQMPKTENCRASDLAEIDNLSCIAEGCIIADNARIINSTLGENVIVEKDAVIENSVIWSGTKISAEARISDSIIGSDCVIGENAIVSEGAMLGDNTFLADFTSC